MTKIKVLSFMEARILVGKAHDKHTIKPGRFAEAKEQVMPWEITGAGWSGVDSRGRLGCTEP